MISKMIDIVTIKKWKPKTIKSNGCYLYNFKHLGVTPQQVADVIIGKKAAVFEKPFREVIGGKNCPWCDFKAGSEPRWHGRRLQDHIFTHKNKNILSYQLVKFQKEIYTLRLQLVRKGYFEAMPFFVEHTCPDCLSPKLEERKNMCVHSVSPRSRMRSLSMMGYPVKHITKSKKREYSWSALAVIVLMRTEINPELSGVETV